MKQVLLFSFALSLATLGCKKESDTGSSSDPRDAFVGTYSISANYTCSDCFGNFWTNSYTGTIVVKKGANENQLLFSDTYQTNHPVTLNGSSFTIEDFAISGGGIGSGGGSFGSNSISYNLGNSYGNTCSLCTEEGSGAK